MDKPLKKVLYIFWMNWNYMNNAQGNYFIWRMFYSGRHYFKNWERYLENQIWSHIHFTLRKVELKKIHEIFCWIRHFLFNIKIEPHQYTWNTSFKCSHRPQYSWGNFQWLLGTFPAISFVVQDFGDCWHSPIERNPKVTGSRSSKCWYIRITLFVRTFINFNAFCNC